MYFLSRFTEITNMRHTKEMGGKKTQYYGKGGISPSEDRQWTGSS